MTQRTAPSMDVDWTCLGYKLVCRILLLLRCIMIRWKLGRVEESIRRWWEKRRNIVSREPVFQAPPNFCKPYSSYLNVFLIQRSNLLRVTMRTYGQDFMKITSLLHRKSNFPVSMNPLFFMKRDKASWPSGMWSHSTVNVFIWVKQKIMV